MSRQPILLYAEDERLLGELPRQLRLDGYDPHCARGNLSLHEGQPASSECPLMRVATASRRERR